MAAAARELWAWAVRRRQILFFAGGFLFDLLTLDRIDAGLDLAMQGLYLAGISGLLVQQERERLGLWKPSGRLERAWEFNVDALHFFYGGLLSAYTIFYAKSTTGSRSVVFLALVAALMVANEMPQIQRAGHRLRLGLHAFCAASFFNYLVPVLLGRMGGWVFALALGCAAALSAGLLRLLRARYGSEAGAGAPAAALALLALFYAMKWIPPVPLSVQFSGVYHAVEREGDGFALRYERPARWAFWRKDDAVFRARDGDRVHVFVRVFAPTRFFHRVVLHWKRKDPQRGWESADRIPLEVRGGRRQGFRGVAVKSHFAPGRWLVAVETEDGRVIGQRSFSIVADESASERDWLTVRM